MMNYDYYYIAIKYLMVTSALALPGGRTTTTNIEYEWVSCMVCYGNVLLRSIQMLACIHYCMLCYVPTVAIWYCIITLKAS